MLYSLCKHRLFAALTLRAALRALLRYAPFPQKNLSFFGALWEAMLASRIRHLIAGTDFIN